MKRGSSRGFFVLFLYWGSKCHCLSGTIAVGKREGAVAVSVPRLPFAVRVQTGAVSLTKMSVGLEKK